MWSWNCWVFLPRFTLLQGCPPQSSLLIPTNSLHPGSSLRSHARFHVRLVKMFVTDCFCFSVRCNRFDLGHFFLLLFFSLFMKLPVSFVLNERACWIRGLGPCEDLSLFVDTRSRWSDDEKNLPFLQPLKMTKKETHTEAHQTLSGVQTDARSHMSLKKTQLGKQHQKR